MHTITIDTPSALITVAEQLLHFADGEKFFVFEGEMAAGKTTFIKALCALLGVEEVVSSPTFAIVNEYGSANGLVYHFDFYRIKDETEALDMGVEEYFDSGYFCFVEWPGKIESLWPSNYLLIQMEADETGMRTLQVRRV